VTDFKLIRVITITVISLRGIAGAEDSSDGSGLVGSLAGPGDGRGAASLSPALRRGVGKPEPSCYTVTACVGP
jgi:hypothetical protein